ncbi:hypothetical protein [Sphingopyxis chilensis]|uniref:hypothetical protein n=1 Tax=Sphingopyxis chilensis TaxID=180400 RepID=UPI002DDD0448|nr:hypothetical protein [Sphingopyxis chilensis]
MDEIDAMKAIDAALASLPEDAKQRVLTWANSKFNKQSPAQNPSAAKPATPSEAPPKHSSGKKSGSPKPSKKAKSVISIDKQLNLMPNGKESAIDFSNKKNPKNHLEKGLVAVYYISKILEIEAVNISQVYTFYKHLSWQVPANLANALSKAGVEGWLDTSDQSNLKVAVGGENYVEHKMGAGA